MKKIAIAALAAVMALGLTACGGKNKDSADKTADSASAETGAPSGDTPGIVVIDPNEGKTAVNDTSSAAGHDPDKDEQTVIEIKDPDAADTSSAAEKKKESKPVFTVKADEAKWETTQESSSSTSIIYKGDDIADAKDNCSIMINSRVVETMAEMTLSEVADAVIDSKGMKDLIDVTDRGDTKIGGHAAYTVSGVYTSDGVSFDIDISIMAEDTNVLEVWVISYDQCTSAMRDNFNKVLKTISFSKT